MLQINNAITKTAKRIEEKFEALLVLNKCDSALRRKNKGEA